tara:strand:- start:596 stop:850 length:255 start_codon:yes stop_codon:yes gene_type:complete
MSFFDFLVAPLIIFLVIVAPIWLIMHYRHKEKTAQNNLPGSESEIAERLLTLIEKMESRIDTLEKILDADDPRWREKNSQNGIL